MYDSDATRDLLAELFEAVAVDPGLEKEIRTFFISRDRSVDSEIEQQKPIEDHKYWAFISYSHDDAKWGNWLHNSLEKYRVPARLVGRKTSSGNVPRRIYPVFRDREEFGAASKLKPEIKAALEASRFLVVICSNASAKSHWVNEEIKAFKMRAGSHRVLCVIVDGEPNSWDGSGECFPEAIRFELSASGDVTSQRAEPIAADARPQGDGKFNAKLKVLSGLLGLKYDELRQRERTRRRWRMTTWATTLLTLGLIAWFYLWTVQQDHLKQQDVNHSRGLVAALLVAKTENISEIISDLEGYWPLAKHELESNYVNPPDDVPNAKLHAALAMLSNDKSVLEYLRHELLLVSPVQFRHVRDLMVNHLGRLNDEYWDIARNGQDPARRFQAACVLASHDPSNTWWKESEFCMFIANYLVRVRFSDFGPWRDALADVRSHLVAPLAKIFRSDELPEAIRLQAAETLADYLKDDPETVVDLLVDADATAFERFFPVLQSHLPVAIKELEQHLAGKVTPIWNDPSPETPYPGVDHQARAAIESAHGMISGQFAFCQTLPWGEFVDVSKKLRTAGYRPTRVRPHGESVAAVWKRGAPRNGRMPPTRDRSEFLTRGQLPSPDSPATSDGLVPIDIALLPDTGSAEPRFLLVWSEPDEPDEQRRILVDISEPELVAARDALIAEGFTSQSTITVWADKAGQRRYAGIWSNTGAASELKSAYAGFEMVDQPQWDVAVAEANKLNDPLDEFRRTLADIDKVPTDRLMSVLQRQPEARFTRAEALFRTGQYEAALSDLDVLVEQPSPSAATLYLRAWTLARLKKAERSKEALAEYLKQEKNLSMQRYAQIIHAAWLGNHPKAITLLDAAETAAGQDADSLYDAACAAAMASNASSVVDTLRASTYGDRAIILLTSVVAAGYTNADHISGDADLVTLHGDARFSALITNLKGYAGVWRANVDFESRTVTASSPRELLTKTKSLFAQNFRPVAIAVLPPEGPSPSPAPTMVLHRPIVPEKAKERLAERQATAATALLRLNETKHVWPMFHQEEDSRRRSFLLHRLVPYGVKAELILQQLAQETVASRRRALLLAVGEFAKASQLTAQQQSNVTDVLAKWYADDSDSGVHAAAEWALRQLGAARKIARIRASYATGQILGERKWYVTRTGDQAMVVVDSEEPFVMGSPVTEVGRYQGPAGRVETRHRRRIGRRFAIGAHEVTVAQFKRFRKDHKFSRTYAREPDAPANMISWGDAAEFCNWLSEKEGIRREQWCYEIDSEHRVTIRENYLQRIGYRLPTEAEWEFACRAGSSTARFFGETEQLLAEYAWYAKNSQRRWMRPVCSLKPNDYGLFDTYGNCREWCDDKAQPFYKKGIEVVLDRGEAGNVAIHDSRVWRGGTFEGYPISMRSAHRRNEEPRYYSHDSGLRVSRTLAPAIRGSE